MRGWPRTLFARLVLILVGGMLGAQVLTGSVWYEVRHTEAMEIPLRLAAARLADVQREARREPAALDALVKALDRPGFRLTPSDAAPPTSDAFAPAAKLLKRAFVEAGGAPADIALVEARLLREEGDPAGWMALFTNQPTRARLRLTLQVLPGQWLEVTMIEAQGWTSRSPFDDAWSVLLRLYLLRILVVALVALVAVRLAIGPLKKLARAAQGLGQDIRRPPLPIEGPLEVRQAAEAFNAMQRRLIDHLAERTRFLAAVSHDLRSPITRLRLRTELLKDAELKARLRQDLDDMEALVAATLEFLREGERVEAFERVDVLSILQGIQADAEEQGERVRLQGTPPRPLFGHPQSLQRALRNLVENALRYGASESGVEVVIEASQATLCLRVLDRGPGIAEEELTRVTEPFYRREASRNRDTGGYGLGLSIVQAVAEAHRGRLVLQNREGGGLEARLELDYREHA
ncbi:ATP-binding protein [Halomonas sp. HNIBRBA4712]|uniref:ATP-binding protein n=1 Tax=Halomonas sp. HNIBRBA4712 TaxID=3373087 RepID=UPI003746B0EA